MAKQIGAGYLETSALTSQNVDKAYEILIECKNIIIKRNPYTTTTSLKSIKQNSKHKYNYNLE